jgi:general secretion pathway protein K
MNKLLKNNRGFALIIVILIVGLMVPMTLQFITSTMYDRTSAARLVNDIHAECAAKSGFNFAVAVLLQDASTTPYDSLHEAWATEIISEPESMVEGAKFSIRILDHSARININEVGTDEGAQETLRRLLHCLENLALEDEEVEYLMDAIVDWVDADDEERGLGGAENAYYQGLSPPYSCRNGPMKTLDELLRVKGMTQEIFNEIQGEITIYGEEGVNVNTADRAVLQSLAEGITPDLAEGIIEYRSNPRTDLSSVSWLGEVPGMTEILPENITVSSSCFEIVSTGSMGETKKWIRAIVKREAQGISILSWNMD